MANNYSPNSSNNESSPTTEEHIRNWGEEMVEPLLSSAQAPVTSLRNRSSIGSINTTGNQSLFGFLRLNQGSGFGASAAAARGQAQEFLPMPTSTLSRSSGNSMEEEEQDLDGEAGLNTAEYVNAIDLSSANQLIRRHSIHNGNGNGRFSSNIGGPSGSTRPDSSFIERSLFGRGRVIASSASAAREEGQIDNDESRTFEDSISKIKSSSSLNDPYSVEIVPIDGEAHQTQLNWKFIDELLLSYMTFEGLLESFPATPESPYGNNNFEHLLNAKRNIMDGNLEGAMKIIGEREARLLREPIVSFYLNQQALIEALRLAFDKNESEGQDEKKRRQAVLNLVGGFTKKVQYIIEELIPALDLTSYTSVNSSSSHGNAQQQRAKNAVNSVREKLKLAIQAELKRTILLLVFPPPGNNHKGALHSPVQSFWVHSRRIFLARLVHRAWFSLNKVEQPLLANLIRYLGPIHKQHFSISNLSSPVETPVQLLLPNEVGPGSFDSRRTNYESVYRLNDSLSEFINLGIEDDNETFEYGNKVSGNENGADEPAIPVYRRDLQLLGAALGTSTNVTRKALIKCQNNLEKTFYYLLQQVPINREYLNVLVKELAESRGLLPISDTNGDKEKSEKVAAAVKADYLKELGQVERDLKLCEASSKHANSLNDFTIFLETLTRLAPSFSSSTNERDVELKFRLYRFQFLLMLREGQQMEALKFMRETLSPLANLLPQKLGPCIGPLSACLTFGNPNSSEKLNEALVKWSVLHTVRSCCQIAANGVGVATPILQAILQTFLAVHRRIYSERNDMQVNSMTTVADGDLSLSSSAMDFSNGNNRLLTDRDDSGHKRLRGEEEIITALGSASASGSVNTLTGNSAIQNMMLEGPITIGEPDSEAMVIDPPSLIDPEEGLRRRSLTSNRPVSSRGTTVNDELSAFSNTSSGSVLQRMSRISRSANASTTRNVQSAPPPPTNAVVSVIPAQYADDVLDEEQAERIIRQQSANTRTTAAVAGSDSSGGDAPASVIDNINDEAIDTLMDMMAFSRSEARALLIRHNGSLAEVMNMLFS